MRYYSEEEILKQGWANAAQLNRADNAINVQLCRDCEHYIPELPPIIVDSNFGYCDYRTNFAEYDNGSIHWFFTSDKGFCNKEDIC